MKHLKFLAPLFFVLLFAFGCDSFNLNSDYGVLAIRGKSKSLTWNYSYSGKETITAPNGDSILHSTVTYDDDFEFSPYTKKGKALIRFNNSKDVIWHKFFPTIVNSTNSFIQQKNNDIYLCSENNRDILVIKFDSNGNPLWQQNYGIPGIENDETLVNFIQVEDGFIIAGNHNNTSNYTDNCFFIIKIDYKGKIVWSKKYDLEYIKSIACKNQSLYIVSASLNVIVTDLQGKILKTFKLGDNLPFRNNKIIAVKDGIIIGGQKDRDLFITKISDNFNIVWQKTFGGKYDEEVDSLLKTSDGSILITSMTISYKGTPSAKNTNNIWIIKCNEKDGSIIWQKVYDLNGEHPSNAIENEKGYLITGGYNNFNGTNKALLLQIDTMGSLPDYKGKFVVAETDALSIDTDLSVTFLDNITAKSFNITVSQGDIEISDKESDVTYL